MQQNVLLHFWVIICIKMRLKCLGKSEARSQSPIKCNKEIFSFENAAFLPIDWSNSVGAKGDFP